MSECQSLELRGFKRNFGQTMEPMARLSSVLTPVDCNVSSFEKMSGEQPFSEQMLQIMLLFSPHSQP